MVSMFGALAELERSTMPAISLSSTTVTVVLAPKGAFYIGGSIIAVLWSFLLLMQDYNVAYGAKRALKRMKRTRKKMKGAGRMLKKVAEKFGL